MDISLFHRPFCQGPIYGGALSKTLEGELSLFIPVNGYVKVGGQKIPFSYKVILYKVKTQSQVPAFGADGIFENGSYFKKASLFMSNNQLQPYVVKRGEVKFKYGDSKFSFSLNNQGISVKFNYTCRF